MKKEKSFIDFLINDSDCKGAILAKLYLMYPHAIFSLKEGEHMNNEIIKFVNGDLELDVTVSPDKETVWLNRNQLAQLFDRDVKTIGKHINNALKEELDDSTVAKFATVQTEGNRKIQRSIEYYNLDMIISVGYRVKSQNGVIFRKWATSILKDYMMKGYAINEKKD